MRIETMSLLDENDCVVATLTMENLGHRYGGTIDLQNTPDDLKQLFNEFEELVSGQMFNLVEEVEDAIDARCSRVQLADGTVVRIHNLQPNPSNGQSRISTDHTTRCQFGYKWHPAYASPSIERQSR